MGADIHVYCERHDKDTNQWEHLSLYKKNLDDTYKPIDIYNGRNYELFGLLAGVRGSSHFFSGSYGYIVEPRGLPSDLSSYTQDEWEKGKDGNGNQWWHTPTWYDLCELETYAYLLKDFDNTIKEKNKTIRHLEEEIEKLHEQQDNEDENCECPDWFSDDEDDDYNGFDALECFVGCIKDVLHEYGIWYPKPNEIRIVMWFDN